MDEALSIPGMGGPQACSTRSLERLRAGELDAAEAEEVRAHAASCAQCGARLAGLEREAAEFKREVPFDRFESAVARKGRELKRRSWVAPMGLALAAGLAAIVVGGQLLYNGGNRHNLIKGAYGVIELFVGGTGAAPRLAKNGETLLAGERVRVGYQTREHRYFLVFSVDEAGVATALYPESGPSLPVDKGPGTHLMPDSLELTGKGLEKVIALFSDEPLEVRTALAAASREFARAGSLERMQPLGLRAEESTIAVRKP